MSIRKCINHLYILHSEGQLRQEHLVSTHHNGRHGRQVTVSPVPQLHQVHYFTRAVCRVT